MPPDGYPAFLQYLQSVRVRKFLESRRSGCIHGIEVRAQAPAEWPAESPARYGPAADTRGHSPDPLAPEVLSRNGDADQKQARS